MKHPRKAKHIRQKQDDKRFAWWFAAGGIAFILLAVGGLLFWHSNQTPPEPIMIYKPVPSSEIKQQQPSTAETQGKTESVSHLPYTDDAGYHHGTVALETATDTAVERTMFDDTATTANAELTDAELAELEHEAQHLQLELIEEALRVLHAEIIDKYPEIVQFATLTSEDIRKRYRTMDDFEAFLGQVQRAKTEFGERIRDLLLELPFEQQLELLSFFTDMVYENWGNDVAAEFVAQLMITLEM